MIQTDKEALHYDVVANTAHKIEKVAQELSSLYKDSFINNERVELRQRHLAKYVDELNKLMKRFDAKTLQQIKIDEEKAKNKDITVHKDSYVQ